MSAVRTEARAMLVECSNCGAPLEVGDDDVVVTCTYCQRANRVRSRPTATRPTGRAPGGSRGLVLAVALVAVVGVAVAAVIPLLSMAGPSTTVAAPTSSASSDPVGGFEPSPDSMGEAGREGPAAGAHTEAPKPQPSPMESLRAPDGEGGDADRAARRATERDARRARARRARAQREAEPEPEPLPAAPDRAVVVRALRGLDLSTCEGSGTVTYGIRVEPSGETDTTSVGPMHTRGPVLGCVRGAIESLRFPPSREGLELRHEFVVPE